MTDILINCLLQPQEALRKAAGYQENVSEIAKIFCQSTTVIIRARFGCKVISEKALTVLRSCLYTEALSHIRFARVARVKSEPVNP